VLVAVDGGQLLVVENVVPEAHVNLVALKSTVGLAVDGLGEESGFGVVIDINNGFNLSEGLYY
jgi:hypothetical protein